MTMKGNDDVRYWYRDLANLPEGISMVNAKLVQIEAGVKHDLQITQNDALRFCKGITLLDMIYIPILHNNVKLLSLEQRRQIKVFNT